MTDTEKGFKPGDRVKMTKAAIEEGLHAGDMETSVGTVVGIYRPNDRLIMVRRDKRKTAERYHSDFWEKIKSGSG